jgi:hypothetical protein
LPSLCYHYLSLIFSPMISGLSTLLTSTAVIFSPVIFNLTDSHQQLSLVFSPMIAG